MRELHGYHGEHRRRARDMAAARNAPGKHARDRAHDAPKHASHDAPTFKILLNPEARKAERFRYEQKVKAAQPEAGYAARHAKPKPGEKVAASVLAAVVGNAAWGNRRWKERHGN